MTKKSYTQEEKNQILARAAETTIEKAAKEFGVSKMSIHRWKAENKAVADAVEVKKNARAAARKTKEKAASAKEKTAAKAAAKKEDRKETRAAVKAVAEDQKAATEIEVKKTVRKAGKKVSEKAETVKKAAGKSAAKHAAARLNLIFQSQAGGAASYEQIAAKVPAGTTDAYVKIEENKIYYVLKDGSTGSVDIW